MTLHIEIKGLIQTLSSMYANIYSKVCGSHPWEHPWHFQWQAVRELRRDLHSVLAEIQGAVLDFGCGMQPYRAFLIHGTIYTGVDVTTAPGVDHVLAPEGPLPFADDTFDAFCAPRYWNTWPIRKVA